MQSQTAGSMVAEAKNSTMPSTRSCRNILATTEQIDHTMDPFYSADNSHEDVSAYAVQPPNYTRGPGDGEALMQYSLVLTTSTDPCHAHRDRAASNHHAQQGTPFNRSESVQILVPEAGLQRGLQIPSRMSYITSGFRLPTVLLEAGVDEECWKQFCREAESYGALSKSQWWTICGGGFGRNTRCSSN